MKPFLILLWAVSIYAETHAQKAAGVDPSDLIALKLILLTHNRQFGTATGFIMRHNNANYLITNLHNFTGIDYYSQKYMDTINHFVPDEVIILAHKRNKLGEWVEKKEPLFRSDARLWNEIEISNSKPADVVSLKLSDPLDISIYPALVDTQLIEKQMFLISATPIYLSGYPFGFTSSKNYPIWKYGILSSVYEDEPFGLPVFLIDAHTHPGMSGSPVFLRGAFKGVDRQSRAYADYESSGILLGIFSGDNPAVETGVVWKYEIIEKLLAQSN